MKFLSVLFLTLTSAVAIAQDAASFSDADRDGNGVLDKREASDLGISSRDFERLDSDGDGAISESEYQSANRG